MKELVDTLARQADRARPKPDLDDVFLRDDRRRRRTRLVRTVRLTLVTAGAVAVLAATAVALRPSGRVSTTSVTTEPVELRLEDLGGMVISGAGADQSYPFNTLDRSDPTAEAGPHSVVVRRRDGNLIAGNAIVTYPTEDATLADGEIRRTAATNVSMLAAPRPGGRITVRGAGLTDEEIAAIAEAVTVVDGRPVMSNPSASFVVVAAASYRPHVIREARYGCDALGENAALGALCYTGLATSAGFVDALYQGGFTLGPPVDGHLSVVSTVGGGNATLAWEPNPGLIAFVGYSGVALDDDQIAALARLAERAKLLSPSAWADSRPRIATQTNRW